MEVELVQRPANTAALVRLGGGESLTAEAGAMIAMSGDMGVSTTTHTKGKGSVLRSVKRLLGGESFFLNHFTAGTEGGELWLAPTLSGDMMVHEIDGVGLVVQGGSYLAHEEGVDVDLGWQGFKSLLSGERVFWLRLQGRGRTILSSFGAIYPIPVHGAHVVDTGHIVAFEETLDFKVTKAAATWASSILGGEGLVCRFEGRGTVWCQSHNPKSFGRALGPKLKPR